MPSIIRISELEYDDNGNAIGVQFDEDDNGQQNHVVRFPTIQALLVEWLPVADEGGYEAFIDRYQLHGVLDEKQLERLFTNPKTRMGKRLAGLLSILVPSEYCSWLQMKNMYERVAADEKEEIEITDEAARAYMGNLSLTEGLEFKHLLRLHRRFNLMTQEQLGKQTGMSQTPVFYYEKGPAIPSSDYLHKLCDELKVSREIRFLLFYVAGKGALAKLEDKDEAVWREGFESFTGGKSLLASLLYNLRANKEWNQQKLADEVGIPHSTIRSYEKSRTIPPPAILIRLCDALIDPQSEYSAIRDVILGIKELKLKNDEENRTWLGKTLRSLREAKGWTQAGVGGKVGKDQSTINYYEKGVKPSVKIAAKLCNILEPNDETRERIMYISKSSGKRFR